MTSKILNSDQYSFKQEFSTTDDEKLKLLATMESKGAIPKRTKELKASIKGTEREIKLSSSTDTSKQAANKMVKCKMNTAYSGMVLRPKQTVSTAKRFNINTKQVSRIEDINTKEHPSDITKERNKCKTVSISAKSRTKNFIKENLKLNLPNGKATTRTSYNNTTKLRSSVDGNVPAKSKPSVGSTLHRKPGISNKKITLQRQSKDFKPKTEFPPNFESFCSGIRETKDDYLESFNTDHALDFEGCNGSESTSKLKPVHKIPHVLSPEFRKSLREEIPINVKLTPIKHLPHSGLKFLPQRRKNILTFNVNTMHKESSELSNDDATTTALHGVSK